MNKFIRGTIFTVGLLLCTIVLLLNIFIIAKIDDSSVEARERVKLEIYNLKYLIITFGIIAIILIGSSKLKRIFKSQKLKMIGIGSILIIYVLLQILWINKINAFPSYDQERVYDTAVLMYEGRTEDMLKSEYLEKYPQQITLATLYVGIFKMFNSTNILILQYINAIANAVTILAIILISNQLGKKYQTNKIRTMLISISFLTLPLLSTFIYGDILSIPMCMFAIYFIMKYSESTKIRFAIISMILMAAAYISRMNNLIYIIALTIYLCLDILKIEQKSIQEILKKIVIIILFVVVSMLPARVIKSYWQHKLQLEKENKFPTMGFVYMGMQEGERAKGWYNQEAELGFKDHEVAEKTYKIKIQERINHFISHPMYFIEFYAKKTASMWAENTYASLWYNKGHNFGIVGMEETIEEKAMLAYQTRETDKMVDSLMNSVQIWQKAIVLIIFSWTILVLVKYRKNLSNEILLLVTVFIGGFLFHTIWEAKSRYIISYIVVLIPISAISIQNFILNFIKRIKARKRKNGNGEKNEIINSNSNL